MEPKFQNSFIPKRSTVPIGGASLGAGINSPQRPRGGSLLLTFSVILFTVSLLGAGGVYGWKNVVASNLDRYKQQLIERQKQFNPELIGELKRANTKIDTVKQLLDKHLALSGIFSIISSLTIENVRFLGMDLTTPGATASDLKVSLNGYGTSLAAVAFQSDVLSELEQYGLRKIVKNPMMTDPSLDSVGTFSFGLTASIDPSTLIYKKNSTATSNVGNTTSTASSTNSSNNQSPFNI